MANYPISNVTRRVVYTGSAGVGPYAFSFEIIENTDIAVYKNDVLLTLTTNYTVTINANGTGSVTLVVAATSADNITIVGARAVERTTDFSTGGDLFANTINEELDSEVILIQQVAESNDRAIKAPVTDPTTIDMTLPAKATRAYKLLAFDADGNPIADEHIGTNRGNWAASTVYYVRDLIKDTSNSNIYQCLVEHTSSGSQPISTNTDSAKWSLVVNAAAAATSAAAAAVSETNAAASAILANDWATKTSGPVAGGEYSAKYHATAASSSASTASTAATNASNAQTAAEAARDQTLASFDSFDDRYLGSKTSAPTLDNDGNALLAGALYFNSVSGVMNVYTGSAWVAAYVTSPVITGTTTFGGAVASPYTGFKNRIINGAMIIDARNAGASVTATSTGSFAYTLDRFSYRATAASKFTVQQNAGSVTPPTGFINYLGVTSSSAYSVSASDFFAICQIIEGLNIADFGWGTANAVPITLSFKVYSSLTGTFGGSISNNGFARSYPFSYTISSANTWTSISVTIPGDTSGTWLTTIGVGMFVNFGIGVGSTNSGTVNAWASAQYFAPTGAVSVVGTNAATWYVTGVQLEVGSAATSFEYRSYGTELALCQRYYEQANIAVYNTVTRCMYSYHLPKRSNPTVTLTTGTIVNSYEDFASYSNGTDAATTIKITAEL